MLTALMLTGRIGSGIAAELGSMVVTDQINALRALGTDPMRKLVVPRVLAGIFMAPVLTVVADFVGILGGWVVARFQLQVSSSLYWSSVTKGLYMQDVWMGLIEAVRVRLRDRRPSRVTSACGPPAARRRRQVDDGLGRRGVGRGDRRRFLRDADLSSACIVLMATRNRARRAKQILQLEPGAPVIVFDHVAARLRRQGGAERSQLHAAQGPHEDHPRRQRIRKIDRAQDHRRAAEGGRGRGLGERPARRPAHRA